jgi:hypothetical protein
MDYDQRYPEPSSAHSITVAISLQQCELSNSDNKRLRIITVGLNDLAEIFQCELSERKSILYMEALSDISLPLFETAVKRIIRSRPRYFPTPGEIREAVAAEIEDANHDAEAGRLALADQRDAVSRATERERAASRDAWNADHPDGPLPQWWRERNPPPPRNSLRHLDEPLRPLRELITFPLPDANHPDVRKWMWLMDDNETRSQPVAAD